MEKLHVKKQPITRQEQEVPQKRGVRDERQQKAATLLAAVLGAENTSGDG